MNFLLEFSTVGYDIRNYMASKLCKLYPGSKFAAIVGAHKNVIGYLKEQKLVKYDFIYNIDNIEKRFLDEEIDYEELRKFEETIPEKSLWRFIAMDKNWGHQFSKGALNVKPLPRGSSSMKNILKVTGGYLKFYKKIFSEFKPGVVIFRMGMHSMMTPILEQFCRNRGIPYISPVGTRIQNYIALTPNKECTFPHINKTYKEIMNGELAIDSFLGEKCYNELIKSFEKQSSDYFFGVGIHDQLRELKNKNYNFVLSNLKNIASTVLHWYRMRILEKSKEVNRIEIFNYRNLYHNLKYNLYRNYQVKKLLFDKKFYDDFKPNEKYLYFPLTVTPEYTTQVQANMWINQLSIIEALAKSCPCDWKIYVKEHPANVVYRARPFSFYEDIKSYTNVKLIPADTNNHEIIKHSQFVINIVGTTGWEAVLFYCKPVINFSEAFYDVTGLSRRCYSFMELSKDIYDEHKRINKISLEERKKRIISLLNAIILNSCWLNNPKAFVGEKPPYPEGDIKNIGETLGSAIKKYLDNIKY